MHTSLINTYPNNKSSNPINDVLEMERSLLPYSSLIDLHYYYFTEYYGYGYDHCMLHVLYYDGDAGKFVVNRWTHDSPRDRSDYIMISPKLWCNSIIRRGKVYSEITENDPPFTRILHHFPTYFYSLYNYVRCNLNVISLEKDNLLSLLRPFVIYFKELKKMIINTDSPIILWPIRYVSFHLFLTLLFSDYYDWRTRYTNMATLQNVSIKMSFPV